mgnify:FL=1
MKIDSKPFQLESELLNIDEMLANDSVDMDFQPIVSSERNDSVIVSNKAAVVCVKVRFNYSSLSSKVVRAYRIIDKVMYDIFIDNDSCVDVLHVGHYYIGVFYAPQTINIDNVLDTMGRLNAALSILDIKFKKNLDMSFGGVMAADFGEIMYSKVLAPYESWQGAPVNNVIALCEEVYSKDNKEYDGVTLISDSIKINLKEEYAKFFNTELSSTDHTIKSYKAYVVNTAMYNWVKKYKLEQDETENGNKAED